MVVLFNILWPDLCLLAHKDLTSNFLLFLNLKCECVHNCCGVHVGKPEDNFES